MSNELLTAPFDISKLEFRPGGRGTALVYVELWEYLKRLDEAVPNEWSIGESKVLATQVVTNKDGAEETVVSLLVPVTIGERTEYGLSDMATPTKAYAQAVKRALAVFGLGRYLYDAPTLSDAYAGYDLKVDPSVLVARCYEAWGLELPRGFQVVDTPPARNTRPASNGNSPRQASRQESSSDGQNPEQHKGKISVAQAKKLYSVGITDEDILNMSTQDARQAVTDAFDGADAAEIREKYVQSAPAAAPSGSRRQRW